ncbi:hypothetical protein GGR20_002766 [Devosia subaequoris]|uniref:Uncharacterized protein n=1 Tax=Devosia subaequoris TaxID=395930 RepID=A0A7W6IQ97_9HYPH|nr:hypothetical protein [Devosia subaequoris]
MVSVTKKSLTMPSLSGTEREHGADTRTSQPRRSPQRDGGVFCPELQNDE